MKLFDVSGSSSSTDLDDVLVLEFAKIFNFPDGGHVQSILKLPDFDFLDSDFPACGNLSPCGRMGELSDFRCDVGHLPLYTTAYVPSPIFCTFALERTDI